MSISTFNNSQYLRSEYTGPEIKPGTVVLSFCKKANKVKWYLVLAKSHDDMLYLTVLFNSRKPFQAVKHLEKLQFHLSAESIKFLQHDSFANCAHPETKTLAELQEYVKKNPKNYKGDLSINKLDEIRTMVANAKTVEKKTINEFGLSKFKIQKKSGLIERGPGFRCGKKPRK
jgi:hypothetical protein